MPEEITRKSPSTKSIFGFPNTELGEHIERAYQTLAINETRLDFVSIRTILSDLSNLVNVLLPQNCNKFEQTQGGRRKGQVLKQVSIDQDASDDPNTSYPVLVQWYVNPLPSGRLSNMALKGEHSDVSIARLSITLFSYS